LRLLFAVCFALFPCSNYNAGAFRFLPVLHPVTSGGSRVVPVGPLVLPSEEVSSLGSMGRWTGSQMRGRSDATECNNDWRRNWFRLLYVCVL